MKEKKYEYKRTLKSGIIKCLISIIMFLYLFMLNLYFSIPTYSYYHSLIIIFIIMGIWMLLPKIVDILFLVVVSFSYLFYVLA